MKSEHARSALQLATGEKLAGNVVPPGSEHRTTGWSAPIRKMIAGVTMLVAVCALAATGYMIAGWAPGEAVCMVVITVFAAEYGEVQPVTTWPLRTLTIMLIVTGYGAVVYTVGGFIQLVVDGEFNRVLGARRMTKDIEHLSDHTIICGYG